MFDPSAGSWDVPADLQGLLTDAWSHLATPGSGWTGEQRIAIAEVSRAARAGSPTHAVAVLPDAAVDAATLITTAPAEASESWVRQIVAAIGEVEYVELVGVVASVVSIDTLTRLIALPDEPLPEATPGAAKPPGPLRNLKRRSAWVSMTGPPLPRHALSAVPATQAMANRLLDRLYMSREELRSESPVRGLSRTQMETVILSVSHGNECFY